MNFTPWAVKNICGNGICIFEWGEMIEYMLRKGFIKITLTHDLENTNFRKLTIEEF